MGVKQHLQTLWILLSALQDSVHPVLLDGAQRCFASLLVEHLLAMDDKTKAQIAEEDLILLPYGEVTVLGKVDYELQRTWETLWSNGKVGYRDTQHTLPKGRKQHLQKSTKAAIIKLEKFIVELHRGLKRLETMEEKDYDALEREQRKKTL